MAKRDLEAAKRFFRKMLQDQPLLAPDRIGTDGAAPYPPAIAASRKEGLLPKDPLHYVTKHLQQGIESDHFQVKRPMPRVGGFQTFPTAGARSRVSRRCCGCARALALRVPERCANRTSCSRSASVSQRLTRCETGVGPGPSCGLRQTLRQGPPPHSRTIATQARKQGRWIITFTSPCSLADAL